MQAQHRLRGLPQAHHLKATESAAVCRRREPGAACGPPPHVCVAVGGFPTPGAPSFPLSHPLACPGLAPEDTHLYVALGRVPFGHCELQWLIVGVIHLGDKTPIPGVRGCSPSSPLHTVQLGQAVRTQQGPGLSHAAVVRGQDPPRHTGRLWPEPHCGAGLSPSGRGPREPWQQSRRQASATRCDWSLGPELSTGHGYPPGGRSEGTLQSDRVTEAAGDGSG